MPKTALITGASSGIGLELAKIFAHEGYDLLITARRRNRLTGLKKELESRHNINVYVYNIDLAEPESPEKIFAFTKENKLSVNVLVNNAGIGDYGFFHEADWDRLAKMIDLNIKSLTHLTHLFIPMLSAHKKAYILNIASTASFQPGPLMSIYYASKHYVRAFSEAIANELQHTGIKVSVLCPGPTESEFQEKSNQLKSKLFDRLPVATSEEVAEYGYKSLMKGKRVAIHGALNKVVPKIISLVPRRFVTAVVRKIQERK